MGDGAPMCERCGAERGGPGADEPFEGALRPGGAPEAAPELPRGPFRSEAAGFELVLRPDGRRGLWLRRVVRADGRDLVALVLVAGREGDDAGLVLRQGETITRRALEALDAVLGCLWMSQINADDAARSRRRRVRRRRSRSRRLGHWPL